MDFRFGDEFDFAVAADFTARIVDELMTCPCPRARCSTSTCPAGHPVGVRVTRLGKRIYRDELKLDAEEEGGRRRYWIYGA
jgi:broad specificity polyphosphatase/5'/3'-nucleotidase SurE